MSSDVFRRVGRGGAGNFYSQQDVQDAEKKAATTTDLEAQDQPANALTLTPTHATGSSSLGPGTNYTRAGRGGAGNFTFSPSAATNEVTGAPTSSADAAAQKQQEKEEADRAKANAAVVASLAAKSRAGGLSGRGGAGNWSFGGGGREEEEAEVRRREEELERKILRDVEVGLAPPAKAYVPLR
ncbi:predicted protein [Chaetomium globosum CBS 148.51]|uniref:Uncharacterized protein n=1 Tax=Chaetomium globosum (strain ATCC 6205 / CBS 148.51 / DSM 1962 / NBRC 6347 / NRRL 1970) TaxID=306901 RepID=Q2H6C8_CHAGB|nr:uncharacterized protein CHGG_05787 [Chaetomium globosum CBS 148.51]EAQ89168.1 predicted protein [Chaetomium globosum CBS 148.51]